MPIFDAGVFDESVFEPDTSVGSPAPARSASPGRSTSRSPRRLWIPLRFSTLDTDGEIPVNERLRLLLDRHRPAGIHIYVEYADDRWTMPAGILRDEGSDEPLGTVIVGTALWADRDPDLTTREIEAMALTKPALTHVNPGEPVTAQGWNTILDGVGDLFDAVLAFGKACSR